MPKPPKHKRKVGSGDGTKSSQPTPASVESELDPLENFEIELLWCIQQIESSISAKKMNPRAAEDTMKTLNTLKSNKAPLIKKRQVMRTLFGDYRAKMAEEEKKFYKANSNLKFTSSSAVNKSKFLKKSSTLVPKSDEVETSCTLNTNVGPVGEEIFCAKAKSETGEERITPQTEKKSFSFKPSDNQFRFKFSSSEDDPKG